ncbi:hypothetical protein [Ferrimonas balearica]|uniref:hypothetical protein n=1 Tax=Ferrimonas balearica TaxID=44012 RepID=UPI001C99428A|nr:hypothetical protein [Ferrimonas balearica]MBY5994154.1 hypothetical protein [Ferrimonas balearica]
MRGVLGLLGGMMLIGCSGTEPREAELIGTDRGQSQEECLVLQQQCRVDAYSEWERADGSWGCACTEPMDPNRQAFSSLPDHR